MNYKLKVEGGMVNFLQKTGNDFVKSQMSDHGAQRIIKEKGAEYSDLHKDYPIKAGDFYFEGKSKEEIEAYKHKSMVVGYTRALRRTIKREPENIALIDESKKQLYEAIDKVDSIVL